MPKPIFSDIKLKQLVNDGLNGSQIAKHLGVSKGAVSQRLKSLKLSVAKDITLIRAGEVVRKEINAVGQLQKINAHANELLDLLMACMDGDKAKREDALKKLGDGVKDPKELALKAMQEIRGQLKLQLEIFQTLYDMQAVAEFQKEVLEAIEDASPETRDRIIHNLKEKRAIRSTLEFH
jgi:predicted transcriptional regulator